MFHYIALGNDFIDMTEKAQVAKAKIHKWRYIKLQNYCISKNTINRVKRQTMRSRQGDGQMC